MEALAIIGGIAAVGQAAELTTKWVDILYHVSCKAEAIAQDVDVLACHLSTFASIISSAHCTIRDHYESDRKSKTIQRLNDDGTFRNLASQTKYLMRRVKGLKKQLKDYQATPDLVARFLWTVKKGSREFICLWMDRVQALFQFIMTQITYESLKKRLVSNSSAQDPELCNILKEMERCERMIGTHRQTMRVYKTRQQSLKYSDFQSRGERRSATIDDIENTLLEIESEMVMESATRRDSRSSLNSASTGSHSSDRDVYRDDERNPRDAGIADPRHHRRRRRPLQESSNEFLLRTTNEPNSIQFRDVLQHHQTLPTPESSSFSVDESMMQIRGEPEPGGALHLDEGDYIAVRPSDRVLHLSPSLDYQIVEGYVNSKTSPTSANTCYDITENIISELYAAQLGLQIFYCETDDDNHADIGTMERDIEREIDFGNGDVRPVIGSTCFDWKDSPQANGLRPLKVTCLVSRYVPLQTQLVFGQPFLRRREHYWRR